MDIPPSSSTDGKMSSMEESSKVDKYTEGLMNVLLPPIQELDTKVLVLREKQVELWSELERLNAGNIIFWKH